MTCRGPKNPAISVTIPPARAIHAPTPIISSADER